MSLPTLWSRCECSMRFLQHWPPVLCAQSLLAPVYNVYVCVCVFNVACTSLLMASSVDTSRLLCFTPHICICWSLTCMSSLWLSPCLARCFFRFPLQHFCSAFFPALQATGGLSQSYTHWASLFSNHWHLLFVCEYLGRSLQMPRESLERVSVLRGD